LLDLRRAADVGPRSHIIAFRAADGPTQQQRPRRIVARQRVGGLPIRHRLVAVRERSRDPRSRTGREGAPGASYAGENRCVQACGSIRDPMGFVFVPYDLTVCDVSARRPGRLDLATQRTQGPQQLALHNPRPLSS